jgi:hypothetical protein
MANDLSLSLQLYQNGILRVKIDEPGTDRFSISDHGFGVDGHNLRPVDPIKNFVEKDGNNLLKI